MRVNLHSVFFLFLILFTAIGFSAPLSGIYTIGGSSPSYASFNAAVSGLLTNGVSGPVVFNVRPGTYNEQITITAVTGASGANTITFQSQTGNRSDVTLTYAATGTNNNWVVNLNGTSFISFNNMTLQSTGTTYSNVVYIYNAAEHDTVKNCTVTAPPCTSVSTNQVLINLGADQSNSSYHGVYNDSLINGSYGVYAIAGYPSTYVLNYYIENNVFLNQYAYGLYNFRALNCAIRYNTITTNSTLGSYDGIYVGIAFGDSIASNKIVNCPGNGIWYDNGEPHIFNNFVEIIGTDTNYGITFTDMNEDGTTPEITYNTVLVLNTNTNSSAFYIPTGYDQPVNYMHDNIFVNRGGGYAVNIVETGEVSYPNGWSIHAVFDYNDLYTTGTYIGNWGGVNCTTLANWQSTISTCGCGGDSHSVNINPGFVSNTDLHLTVDNLRYGTPDIEVNYDIDNQARSTTTPDVGADEFSGVSATAQFTASSTTVCTGSQVTFTDQSTGSPQSWKWTFASGTPASSSSQSPTISYDTAGTFTVKLVITTGSGSDSITKTGYITVIPPPSPGTITASSDSVCSGDSTLLTVTGSTGNILWQLSTVPGSYSNIGGASLTTYNTSALSKSTAYRVIVNNGTCADTSGALKIVVNPLPAPPILSVTDSAICPNDSALITASGSYPSYLWSNNATGAYTDAKIAGEYSVTATDPNGCTAASGQIGIVVYQAPIPPTPATTDSVICSSDSTLITTSGNYSSYLWNTGDTTSYTQAKAAGPYWVTVTNGFGCSAVSTQQDISVFPASSVSIVVQGDTLTSFNSVYYQWYFDNSVIPGADKSVYIAHQSGEYSVQVVDTNGCYEHSNNTGVVISAISEVSNNSLSIYPNPCTDQLFLKSDNTGIPLQFIEFYDVLGRMALHTGFSYPVANTFEIDVTGLPGGIYTVLVSTGTKEYLQKVVKQ